MTPEQFCYWLQGFVEISSRGKFAPPPDMMQWNEIQEHLKTVFNKVTPYQPNFTNNPDPTFKNPLDYKIIC